MCCAHRPELKSNSDRQSDPWLHFGPYPWHTSVRPRMNISRWHSLLLLCAGLFGSTTGCSCGHKAQALALMPDVAPNEVVLTADQIKKMKITTAVVDLQDIDDTVVITGK